jgi:UPF0755 protein
MPPSEESRARDALDMAGAALRLHLSGAWRAYAVLFGLAAALGLLWYAFAAAPLGTPRRLVSIEPGESVAAIAADLKDARVIESPLAFKAIVRLTGRAGHMQAGTYLFSRENAFTVARRVAAGETGIKPIRVTFPEGYASFDMARVLAARLPGFDAGTFAALGREQWEGYLFPDTYDFIPGTTPEQAVERMVANYEAKRASFAADLAVSPHSEQETITMASIVEREAATPEDRRIVAGILWKRLALPMRLQVDAPFAYLHEDWSYAPTHEDLEDDSPYNTYRRDGLPPGPIGNPGIDAIEAALHPADTPYLYYLTGKDGTMHYAKTFEEHKANVARYL